MGRSRGNFQPDEDPIQRSRRKKNAPNGEHLESTSAGQGTSEGKRALYHCNYCNKDITGKIRIKCAVCPDFDLCIECFSVGAEVTPHKSNHPYRVMEILAFPIFCPDWNADEEMLLLEGLEMYGLWNWTEVAEHVGTKDKDKCIEHFRIVYLESPNFPLPDMTHIAGKNRKELIAMAKGQIEDKKGSSLFGEVNLKEESPFSPSRVKVEDMHQEVESGVCSSSTNLGATSAIKKASNMAQVKDDTSVSKVGESQTDISFKETKPSSTVNDGPSLMELSGYNPKRREFDPEYDNDAERLLAEMEFKETDTEEEHELKVRVLHIYKKRLDERKRRKDFILERNLLHPNPFERDLSPEERVLCRRFAVFMRFLPKEEYDDLLKTLVGEHRILKRIGELKEARFAGCRTTAEADRYLQHKRKRETEESSRHTKQSTQIGPNGQPLPGLASSSFINDLDILECPQSQLLSESEKRLCRETGLLPLVYLKMQEVMSIEVFKGNITNRSDAHHLFNIEPTKIDRVYDVLVRKGIANP